MEESKKHILRDIIKEKRKTDQEGKSGKNWQWSDQIKVFQPVFCICKDMQITESHTTDKNQMNKLFKSRRK